MKELKISELMDSYVDNEVCIEGESLVDNEELKQLVLTQAKPKRKIKPLFKGLIVVAAAACLAGATAATAFIISSGEFESPSGAGYHYEVRDDGTTGMSFGSGDYENILTEEDGRLYFRMDNKSTDITDRIDQKTPYIYGYKNTESGETNYIIIGGTPEEYGIIDAMHIKYDKSTSGIKEEWVGVGEIYGKTDDYGIELMVMKVDAGPDDPMDFWAMTLIVSHNYTLVDGEKVYVSENFDDHHKHYDNWLVNGDIFPEYVDIPSTYEEDCREAWLLNALVQLEIMTPALIS